MQCDNYVNTGNTTKYHVHIQCDLLSVLISKEDDQQQQMCLWRETCLLHVEERTRFAWFIILKYMVIISYLYFKQLQILKTYKLFVIILHICLSLLWTLHIGIFIDDASQRKFIITTCLWYKDFVVQFFEKVETTFLALLQRLSLVGFYSEAIGGALLTLIYQLS